MQQSLVPGRTIGAFYILVAPIGKGGFGEVWKAQDSRSGDIVALKMPLHQFAVDPKVITSLKRECGALKTLFHPNICRVIDLVYDPIYGPLLITEYVDGTALHRATAGKGWDDQLMLFVQALQGLNYLHGLPNPVMHLDIKPPNMLVAGGHLKLIDFGIARVRPPEKGSGTFSYMAPEMILNAKSVNTRADLYSLGVVMYECLTGGNPFRCVKPEDTKKLQCEKMPPLPSGKNKSVPPWLDDLVMRLLKKNPQERYASAKEVLNELRLLHEKSVVNAAHLQSFAAASGRFVGRRGLVQVLQSNYPVDASAGFCAHVVQGDSGTGKSRLLREIRFDAKMQVDNLYTVVLKNANDAAPALLEPVAAALTTATAPVLLLMDDYDRWCKDAPQVTGLLEALRSHPHLPTWVGCIMTVAHIPESLQASDFRRHALKPFTVMEVSDYLGAVSQVPEPQRSLLARQLWQHSEGNPARLADVMTKLVAQGFFAAGAGQWDPSLFEDVTIEVTDIGEADKAPAPEDIPRFLIETAETSLARNKAGDALAVMARFPDCRDGLVFLWKGILHAAIGEFESSGKILEEALAAANRQNNKLLAIRVRNQMARNAFRQHRDAEAEAIYRETLSQESSLCKKERDVITNNELGYLLCRKGRYEEALPLLQDIVGRAARAGNRRRETMVRVQLGDCLAGLGDDKTNKAREAYLTAIRCARESQMQDMLSYAYNQLAGSYVARNEQREATEILKRAVSLNYYLNNLQFVATCTINYALGLMRQGEMKEAKHKLAVVQEYIRRDEDLSHECKVQHLLAQAELMRCEEKPEEADLLLDQAEAAAQQYHQMEIHAYAIYMTRAQVRQATGNLASAIQFAARARPHIGNDPWKRKEWETFARGLGEK